MLVLEDLASRGFFPSTFGFIFPPLRNQHFEISIPSSMIDEEPHLYRYTNTKSVNLIDNQKSIKNIVKILFEERKE